ncbi:uncharacterized protein PHACADRAFT_169427 [Phanerochaete carnosa HHB-10118-sp]|uniref:Glycopeptide n=1 Tax=Phanerochaete carnosa (strain HHB-10118-sp) TaxID=650164 RepID=K5W4X8_PHACS|nr:uncharacterized protein PHACADRAFT_169427 [Phanerochaete carnosa HHB-10118-sp]EKM58948.1 hypothetical protein PHACADRAFT_169427 [Phanerochaete carnosa HHB-10118-sp]
MLYSPIFTAFVAAAVAFVGANAEIHTVHFQNKQPLLKANGSCGDNGEGCTLIETTLKNPTTPGSGSSTDISLIPPHTFSVTSGFGYFGAGCDKLGADCTSPSCPTAFHHPNDTHVQVPCQGDNVNLAITFCD